MISALEREGTEALSQAIMRYLDERDLRIAEDPAYAEALAELDERIEGEARARLQALDDRRALRRAGVRSVDDLSDEDWATTSWMKKMVPRSSTFATDCDVLFGAAVSSGVVLSGWGWMRCETR